MIVPVFLIAPSTRMVWLLRTLKWPFQRHGMGSTVEGALERPT